ncbi:MAG: hypothetical protein AB8H12_13915 [Lewinella sp.]
MTIIPKTKRRTRYLIFALIWVVLGIVGGLVDSGNLFFYGYPLIGLLFVFGYFTDGGKKEETEKA